MTPAETNAPTQDVAVPKPDAAPLKADKTDNPVDAPSAAVVDPVSQTNKQDENGTTEAPAATEAVEKSTENTSADSKPTNATPAQVKPADPATEIKPVEEKPAEEKADPANADGEEKPTTDSASKDDTANAQNGTKAAVAQDDDDPTDADYKVDGEEAKKAEEEEKEAKADAEITDDGNVEMTADVPEGIVAAVVATGKPGEKKLHNAAKAGDVKTIEELIAGEWKDAVDDVEMYHYTPLHFAAENGHAEACKVLLKAGADISKVTKMHASSPLHYAAFEGHVEVVKVLIEAGAAVNALTDDNRTPLYQAVFKSNVAAAQELIKAGADASIPASTGKTPADIVTDEAIKELLATAQPPAKKRKVDEDAVAPADAAVAAADKKEN